MSALEQRLADYLGLRRALGYRLVEHGRQLADFVAFLDERGEDTVTVTAALAWASASGRRPDGCRWSAASRAI